MGSIAELALAEAKANKGPAEEAPTDAFEVAASELWEAAERKDAAAFREALANAISIKLSER